MRALMVREQLQSRGIEDPRVLAAMGSVPRHRFVSTGMAAHAYEDFPLGIGQGQTISQPFIVAKMTELLAVAPGDRVLDIGTGSGYQAAVLAELGADVYSIERHAPLAERARTLLAELGYHEVRIVVGDGSRGLPQHAPYVAIVVAAAATHIPGALIEQLAGGGRLVIPLGDGYLQTLTLVERTPGGLREIPVFGCRFVPLIEAPAKDEEEESP